jgi:hypothetical protein
LPARRALELERVRGDFPQLAGGLGHGGPGGRLDLGEECAFLHGEALPGALDGGEAASRARLEAPRQAPGDHVEALAPDRGLAARAGDLGVAVPGRLARAYRDRPW